MMIIFGLLILLFSMWAFLVLNKKCDKIDSKVYEKIKFRTVKTKILQRLTDLADTKFFVLFSVLIIIIGRNKKALVIVSLLIIDALIIEVLKRIFRRERPNIKRLVEETGYSFPSGHMTSATCFYGFIIFLVVISGMVLVWKVVLSLALSLFILVIGYSRIYLGVHYFSDVVGGLLVGSAYLTGFIYVVFRVLTLF